MIADWRLSSSQDPRAREILDGEGGDQFGRPRVQVAHQGDLYPGTLDRLESHINENTIARYQLFQSRLP